MGCSGAGAIRQSLVDEGVSTIFGLPGGAIMPLYARTEDVYPWVPGGTALGDVLPHTPDEHPKHRISARVGLNTKEGSAQ